MKNIKIPVAYSLLAIFTISCLLSCGGNASNETTTGDHTISINAPFKMPEMKVPIFKHDTFNIKDYGAIEENKDKGWEAFKKAIDACSKNGGGVVLVPPGDWLTGPIHLKSNINLHLAKQAKITFSTDTSDYTPLVFSRWEGTELYNFSSLIYANGQKNIAITGKGKLNGQGAEWNRKYPRMNWKDSESAVQRLRKMGEEQVPVKKRRFGPMSDDILYPSFVHLINSKNILLEGFTINNGPYWTVHPTYSENVIIRGLNVETYGQPNGDGINPDACKNVLIENCILNTGDDAITLKSGRNLEGRLRGKATENVVVRNCKALKGHGGITIGSEMSGGVHNVYVHDCELLDPNSGICIKTMRGRGGTVENIWLEDISMDSIQKKAINRACSITSSSVKIQ